MLGFVYKLCSKDPSIEEIYVGSTINIKDRMYKHKSSCNNHNANKYNYKVYKYIRANGGWGNWAYEILEEVEVEDKDELEICYEDSWIVYLEPQLNSTRARRSKAEYYQDNKEKLAEYQKEYRQDNKEKIAKRGKEWREKNKEEITLKKKEYYEENKEQLAIKAKKYREENKERISKREKEKFDCECGGKYTRGCKARHEKSKKHQAFINNKKN